MSLECGECERDLRGRHDSSCSRYRPEFTPAEIEQARNHPRAEDVWRDKILIAMRCYFDAMEESRTQLTERDKRIAELEKYDRDWSDYVNTIQLNIPAEFTKQPQLDLCMQRMKERIAEDDKRIADLENHLCGIKTALGCQNATTSEAIERVLGLATDKERLDWLIAEINEMWSQPLHEFGDQSEGEINRDWIDAARKKRK